MKFHLESEVAAMLDWLWQAVTGYLNYALFDVLDWMLRLVIVVVVIFVTYNFMTAKAHPAPSPTEPPLAPEADVVLEGTVFSPEPVRLTDAELALALKYSRSMRHTYTIYPTNRKVPNES